MRCMACGAEMILVTVIEDVTMPVPGFQRRAYMCSECNETEQRLVFNKPGEQ
jgi:DNA-directed RNA polymerase subunit RPC12/RpoP